MQVSWHDLLHYSRAWIYLLKYPLSFTIAWATIYIRRWRKKRDENNAQGWPSIEGRIISSQAARVDKTTRFIVTLQYSFFLSEYHYGNYIHEFSKESDAEEFARQMKEKRIQIRYSPSNPDKSILEESAVQQHVLLAPRFG